VYPTGDHIKLDGAKSSFGNEFFNANDHWNILPSISYVAVSKSVGDGFSIGAREVH